MRPFNLYEALDGSPVCMAGYPGTRVVGLHLFTHSNYTHRLVGVVRRDHLSLNTSDILSWTPDGVFGHEDPSDPEHDFSEMYLAMWEEGDGDE